MAVNGGVAAFAPRGRLPHISELAFRRVGIERRLSFGRIESWKDDKQDAPGGLPSPPLLGMCSIQLTRHTPIQFNSQLTHDAVQLRSATVLPDIRETTQNSSHVNHLFPDNCR